MCKKIFSFSITLLLFSICFGQNLDRNYFFNYISWIIEEGNMNSDYLIYPDSISNLKKDKIKSCKIRWNKLNQTKEYYFDNESRLVKVKSTKNETDEITYQYDKNNRLISTITNNKYINKLIYNENEKYIFYDNFINSKQVITEKDNYFIIEEYKNNITTDDIFEYEDNAYLKRESIVKEENNTIDIVIYEYTVTKKIKYYYHYKITYDKNNIVEVKYYDKDENINKQINVDYPDDNQIVVDYGKEVIILTDFDKHGNWQKRYRLTNGINEELNTRELEYYE